MVLHGRLSPKESDVSRDHPFNVTLGAKTKDSILIAEETHTKMKGDWTCAFQLELVILFQYVGYLSWILCYDSKVVYVNTNVFIDIAILSHPNIRFSL